ncbi:hypothetical protein ALMP_45010 [Streptomyces sp. A012304]|nr:hypothetical protein ALMP_45010 [Streptomyces sp. A012304]
MDQERNQANSTSRKRISVTAPAHPSRAIAPQPAPHRPHPRPRRSATHQGWAGVRTGVAYARQPIEDWVVRETGPGPAPTPSPPYRCPPPPYRCTARKESACPTR